MTDAKKDPHPHLPGGTGTGPAGGEPIKPTTPARDPAAEAAALAAFEAEEHRLAEVDLPPPAAPESDATTAREAGSAAEAAPPVSGEAQPAPQIEAMQPSASGRMQPLGQPLTNPPVVVF